MCVVVLCTSCASSKKVVYLQDVVPLKQQDIEQKYEVYIHNDDLLAIMVNSKNPELALPFNMPMVTYQLGSESGGQQRVLGYLVDSQVLSVFVLTSCCCSTFCIFVFRKTNPGRDKNGTKPRENKAKNSFDRQAPFGLHHLVACKGTKLSRQKRKILPISFIHNHFPRYLYHAG